MQRLLAILVLFAAFAIRCKALPAWTTGIRKNGYCATYSLCGETDAGRVPCPANIEAQPITEGLAHTMSWFCPVAWEHVKENGHTCCNELELENALVNIGKVKPLLEWCPACFENYKNFMCMLSCSPNQSMFSNVTAVQDLNVGNKMENLYQTGILEVDVNVDKSVQDALFDSCKDVKSGDKRVMEYFGGAKTGAEFLTAIGLPATKGGRLPYQVHFSTAQKEGFVPVDLQITSCAAKLSGCSCRDCPSRCAEQVDKAAL